jgi:Na+/serine symporter
MALVLFLVFMTFCACGESGEDGLAMLFFGIFCFLLMV